MKYISQVAAVVVALVLAATLVPPQSPARGATAPGPRVLVVDKHAIMTGSKLGEDIRRQILAYEDQANAEFGSQGQALQNESQALQQQAPTLKAEVRDKRMQALQARETEFRAKVQARQSLIQGGELVSRKRYLSEVDGIIHAIMLERGADVVIIKSSIADAVAGLDITQAVIQRLDKKISSLKVPLVKPPAGEGTEMQ
jgi:outer membrane protein